MLRNRKPFAVIAGLLTAVLVLSACTSKSSQPPAQSPAPAPVQPIVLKLGTKMPPENPEGKAFQKFADLVAEKSGGKLKVEVYPSEQLGAGTAQIDNLLLGTQDMYVEGSSFLERFNMDYRIASVPYLFESNEHYQKVFSGPIGLEIDKTLTAKGLRVLNEKHNFVRGPYRVICGKKPIKTLDDLKGLKLRAFENSVYVGAWKYLGAIPTVIAWTETYLAIKQNVVDAVTSPISLVYSMKFTEVAPHCTQINEFPQDVVFMINEKKFQSLSPDFQKILKDASHEAGDYGTKLAMDSISADIEKMKKEHGAQFYQIDLKPFANKMEPYHKELEKQGTWSAGLVDKIRGAAK